MAEQQKEKKSVKEYYFYPQNKQIKYFIPF